MQPLRTAILQHTTPAGVHHDWLIEDPSLPNLKAPNAKLWTARVTPPPQHWPSLKRFDLTVIAPHRRAYLTYQGEVSNHRGHVIQRASGICLAQLWTQQRIALTLQTQLMRVHIQLNRTAQNHWIARLD